MQRGSNFNGRFEVEWVEDDEEDSGRRSRPINLATRLGVFVPGEQLNSDDKSFVFDDLASPLVFI